VFDPGFVPEEVAQKEKEKKKNFGALHSYFQTVWTWTIKKR